MDRLKMTDDELGRSYHYGWCGPTGIAAGLRRVHLNHGADGNTVTFLVAQRIADGSTVHVRKVVGIATIDGRERWRWCGECDEPDSVNSSTICGYEPDSLAEAVAEVTYRLTRYEAEHPGSLIYREPKGEHMGQHTSECEECEAYRARVAALREAGDNLHDASKKARD